MTEPRIGWIAGLLIAFVFTGSMIGREPPAESPLRVLNLEGTPYERGVQHGEKLKKDIRTLVDLWKVDLRKSYGTDPDIFIRRFLESTDFLSAAKRWTPELLDEIRGISDASGIKFDTLFAFQLVDEMWVLGRDIMQRDHCTSIGIRKTGRLPGRIAQNLDIPAFYHGFQTLLRIKEPENGRETYVFTFPGFIAANGLNNRSVGVVVNAVQQLEASRDGLPVAFVIRGILRAESFQEAVRFIRGIKHGGPQNYIIGGIDELGSFECSVDTVEEHLPFPDSPFTYHTNHPLKNRRYSRNTLEYFQSENIDIDHFVFPCERYAALREIFSEEREEFDIPRLKDIFRDRSTRINNRGSFGCSIMVLKPEPELHLSPGRPDKEPFLIFRFDEEISSP